MGCITSKKKRVETEPEVEKTYSWSNKEKIDPQEYTIENECNKKIVRKPGSIQNDTPFVLQSLENCGIFLFNSLATVSIDNCRNCTLFIGPTKTSVLMRNCTDCRLMVGCQQFRTRDCTDCVIFLHCITKPVIENSTGMQFACYSFFYPELSDQFKSAGLSVFNNLWYQIYDFNALDGENNNWSLLPADTSPEDYFSEMKSHIEAHYNCSQNNFETSPFGRMELSFESVLSVVPKTRGLVPSDDEDAALVVFFADGYREIKSRELIKEIISNKPECTLIHTKEFIMKEVEALTVFGTDSYNSVISRGSLVVLHYSGRNASKICHDAAKDVSLKTASTGIAYVSGSNATAKRQIGLIFNDSP